MGRDDADELSRLVRQGLAEDVVLLSGGVSAGVLDLVPPVLRGLGVHFGQGYLLSRPLAIDQVPALLYLSSLQQSQIAEPAEPALLGQAA